MAETLITSSVIILMLCAIRILFKGRIRPTVQYGLWGGLEACRVRGVS